MTVWVQSANRWLSLLLLADLGVDSLMLAELMFEAEDNLGINIDSNVDDSEDGG